MSDMCEAVQDLLDVQRTNDRCPVTQEAFAIYLAINKPEMKAAIADYAAIHRISTSTAVAEACRAYFLGE